MAQSEVVWQSGGVRFFKTVFSVALIHDLAQVDRLLKPYSFKFVSDYLFANVVSLTL